MMNKLKKNKNGIITGLLATAFTIMYVTGHFNGELDLVLTKAVNICMECIGIG